MTTALLTVALIWGIGAVTPGPNFLVVTHMALRGSRRLGFFAAAGTATGSAFWGSAGVLGVTLIFTAAPWLYLALKLVGGAYLCWLGLRLILARRRPEAGAGPLETGRPLRTVTAWGVYRRGLLTNITNPKSAAFVTSLVAAAFPAEPGPLLALATVATMVSISGSWYSFLAWSLGHDSVRARYLRWQTGLERGAGLVFMAFGAKLALLR